ncbi:MAG: hypothetical protein ACO1SV_12445 [Fimbriimonas sp.]
MKSRPPVEAKTIRSTTLLIEALKGLTPGAALSLGGRNLDIAVAVLVLGVPVRKRGKRFEMLEPESRQLWVSLANFATSLDAADYAEGKIVAEVGEPPYYAALCECTNGPLPAVNLYRARPKDRARACVLAKVRAGLAVV